eukprot:6187262-Pleurochrysis_carterae.AAC.1
MREATRGSYKWRRVRKMSLWMYAASGPANPPSLKSPCVSVSTAALACATRAPAASRHVTAASNAAVTGASTSSNRLHCGTSRRRPDNGSELNSVCKESTHVDVPVRPGGDDMILSNSAAQPTEWPIGPTESRE